ncbi:adenylate isopentenyltransferase 3, chloroplastic-like [Bidens hawaiensis]|uniref:adenylate isopentenyltransferase 3, chloroplastic-like n=1 Tax=Bidens hawaiensis TaxID=980011 RepID=UPI00404B80D5
MMCEPLAPAPVVQPPKKKIVVVMGASGTGKSRLAMDLAGGVSAEIINSDEMKVYKGLEIVTNKIKKEPCNAPFHLLGVADPETEFTAENFVAAATLAVESIVQRGKLPLIAGGSMSFIEALIDDEFQSRYSVCFLWVDVELPVLHQSLSARVDQMVAAGMVEELRAMYSPNADYTKGIRRAIGVRELDAYFRAECSSSAEDKSLKILLESAINEMKVNTCKLANRQVEKIHRLINVKRWNIHRQDATSV